jgi:hypothetical protein
MIEIALILSVLVSLITLVSRHRLSVRHKALQVTLNRVASERNDAKWRNRDLERSHQAAAQPPQSVPGFQTCGLHRHLRQ